MKTFISDPYFSSCRCGGQVRLHRQGNLTLIPAAHRAPDGVPCPAREAQADILRTQHAVMQIGIVNWGPTALARELDRVRHGV